MGAWWHHLESTWLASTNETVHRIQERLQPKLDTNDLLLVIDVTGDAHQGWLPQQAWDWINQHMLR